MARVARWMLVVALGLELCALAGWQAGRPLGMPVDGVRAGGIASTFGAPRSGGRRRHHGVDIFAPRGTRVRAATSGMVVYTGTWSLGGKVVCVASPSGWLTYYAHLDRWAPGIEGGTFVRQGTVLGRVGNTGNARTTQPHLHFETRPAALLLWPVDPVDVLRR